MLPFSGIESISPFVHCSESPYLAGQTNSLAFTFVNSGLRLFGTKSPSPPMHHKKAGVKEKTVAKKAARDGDYDPPV